MTREEKEKLANEYWRNYIYEPSHLDAENCYTDAFLAGFEDAEKLFQSGMKGACSTCEVVALKNIELEKKIGEIK